MYQIRIASIKKLLQVNSIDALFITSVPTITYLTGYSGFSEHEREAYIIVTKQKSYLLTDARYSHAVQKLVPHFTHLEIATNVTVADCIAKLAIKNNIKKIGFEADNLTVLEYKKFFKSIHNKKNVSLTDLRVVKDDEELEYIKQASQIADNALKSFINDIKPGMSEKQLAYNLECAIRESGSEIAFPTIVAFGSNSAIPHHQTGETKLKNNDVILIDFGAKYNKYCSDMTRTMFIGKTTEEQKKIYSTVLNAQKSAIEFINSKISETNKKSKSIQLKDVDTVSREYIASNNFPSIPHSLGHGIGLEVHESPHLSPSSKDILQEGIVFSIEPGIYLPDFMGVRIEDLFTIKENALVQLTKTSSEFLVL